VSAARGPNRHAGRNTLRRRRQSGNSTAASEGLQNDVRRNRGHRLSRGRPGLMWHPTRNRKFVRWDGARAKAVAGRKIQTLRYRALFLDKPNSNGKPEFDEEMPDENQAMIEALKRDRHFVIVTEWRSKVDVSTGAPVIEKEQIRRE